MQKQFVLFERENGINFLNVGVTDIEGLFTVKLPTILQEYGTSCFVITKEQKYCRAVFTIYKRQGEEWRDVIDIKCEYYVNEILHSLCWKIGNMAGVSVGGTIHHLIIDDLEQTPLGNDYVEISEKLCEEIGMHLYNKQKPVPEIFDIVDKFIQDKKENKRIVGYMA